MSNIYLSADLYRIADPGTDSMLLPACMAPRDNSRHIRHYKRALRRAIHLCLTPIQQEQIQLYYHERMRKSDIARRQASTCSAVCKSMRAAEAALREYITLYMDIFKSLEQEFLLESGEVRHE